VLRSPWLGVFAIVVAGVVGYALSDGDAGPQTIASVKVKIRPTRDTGAGWDFGGGLPDPKLSVVQGDRVLAKCEAKDKLELPCVVDAPIDRGKGAVRVVVVDADSSDDDVVGELVLDLDSATTTGPGAVQTVDIVTSGGGGAWKRFRALWIALAFGLAIATALAVYRRRQA
jgi:hypothetical protein